MSKEEMVIVPREMADQALKVLDNMMRTPFEDTYELRCSLREILAAPVADAQEPAAWGTMQPEFSDDDRTLITDKDEAETYNRQCYTLTPLFTRSDAGEVERLRDELKSTKAALREEMKDAFEFQQKNAALIELLRETSDYLDGSTRNSVWCDSILHKKMKAAIQPAESGASA